MSKDEVTILFVEDDDFTKKLLSAVVRGYRHFFARTGAEALEFYAQFKPNIIFLDIGLPDMSGKEILKRILEQDASSYIVMLSGESFKETVLECVQKGARGFITKPFAAAQFNEYINRYKCEKATNDMF